MMRAASLAFAATMLLGCKDTSPLDYTEPVREGGASDGAVVAPDVLASCRQCVTAGACRSEFEVCAEDPKCIAFVECLLDIGCFSLAQLQDRIECGGPCFQRTGISIGADPSLTRALPINGCTLPGGSCSPACVVE